MDATLLGRPHAFERGEKVYMTTPLMVASPTDGQIEEFAFASAVRTNAPNENIGWLQGRYVEAGRANLNNAMWLSDELGVKAMTPMLMPVTVMHDPRTAVGTIADCKLINETASSHIDTILAIWKHRFPETWEEAARNIEGGQMMQSMECYAPSYSCSECGQPYVKLPNGAERASWCPCLRGDASSVKGRRILENVCFTGTGLIFGSRGGVGAYTEAYLDHFHDEIAEYHAKAHVDSTYKPTPRSANQMGMVQIEESELATLRQERNEARTKVDDQANTLRELTTKAETAEAAQKKAEDEKAAAERERDDERSKAQKTELAGKRMGALGAGFLSHLGDTSKTVLTELAGKASDEEWDTALKEREELASKVAGKDIKRDQAADGSTKPASSGGSSESNGFESEEVASFMRSGVTRSANEAPAQTGATSIRQLARSMNKPRPAAGAAK